MNGYRHNIARRRSGQSLIMAVIIMFILLFVGGLFVAIVARNLLNTGRASDTLSAEEFARAGIEYARSSMENSGDGADWRPAPTPAVNPNDPDKRWLDDGYSRIEFGNNRPGGRALIRVTYAPGYIDGNPANGLNPLGKYIKIESVGRVGFLNPNDPTSYLNTPAPRLRREFVAYKELGLTDFLRFVTNKDKDTKAVASFGVPPSMNIMGFAGNVNPLTMQLGGMQTRTFGPAPGTIANPGAPIRINTTFMPLGDMTLVNDPRNGEYSFVAGGVKIPSGSPDVGEADTDPNAGTLKIVNAQTGNVVTVIDKDDPNWSSDGGIFRDASGMPDKQGRARAISVLDPPLIDWIDPATRVTRYRLLSRESGRLIGPPGNQFNTGQFAMGSGLYINNFGNYERETQNRGIAGGTSLRSIYMRPGSTRDWNGPHYIPPGAYIELGYPVVQDRDANGNLKPGVFVATPGFRVIRDASDRPFRDPSGNIAPAELDFTFLIYKGAGQKPVIKLENEFFRSYLKTLNGGMTEDQVDAFLPDFNGVIFGEGNIRIRGLLANKNKIPIRRAPNDTDVDGGTGQPFTDGQLRDVVNPPALNVVSDQTIYVEGSLVRESPDSMIGLLAREYITINTTMFMSPNKAMAYGTTLQNEEPPYHTDVTVGEPGSTPPFTLDFMYGDDPTAYTDNMSPVKPGVKSYLLLRHAASTPPAYLNFLVNEAFRDPPNNIFPSYRFRPGPPPPQIIPGTVYPLDQAGFQVSPIFEQTSFPLFPVDGAGAPTYRFFNTPGVKNTIRPAVDPDFTATGATQDYLLGRMAVSPLDVRIEAVMYAQNGSFFIIPGYSVNSNPADTRDAAVRRAQDPSYGYGVGTMLRPPGTADHFPFFGEPYDCRITILGAISENRTASIADQAAWMQLWGYIPEVYGSTGFGPPQPDPNTEWHIPDQHVFISELGMALPASDPRAASEKNARITRGLRFMYDPFLHAPYPGYNPNGPKAVLKPAAGGGNWVGVVGGVTRQDNYGRALPPIPRLPVCPGYVFFGEANR